MEAKVKEIVSINKDILVIWNLYVLYPLLKNSTVYICIPLPGLYLRNMGNTWSVRALTNLFPGHIELMKSGFNLSQERNSFSFNGGSSMFVYGWRIPLFGSVASILGGMGIACTKGCQPWCELNELPWCTRLKFVQW